MSVLKDLLDSNRSDFNRRVEAARRADHSLDVTWFSRLLVEGLDPLVESLSSPTLGAWASQAFDLGLELSRQGRCKGPMADRIPRLWKALAGMSRGLAPDFRQNLSKITNALFNLERWGGRPDEFLDLLESVGAGSNDPVGIVLVLSWQCGVPQLRLAALEHARQMPHGVLADLLGTDALHGGLEAWATDPWWRKTRKPPHIAGWIGGFTGDDGPFPLPPVVQAFEEGIFVKSGPRVFQLHADRFGQFLAAAESMPSSPPPPLADTERSGGTLRLPGGTVDLPFPPQGLGVARLGQTIVATSPVSFRVCIVAA